MTSNIEKQLGWELKPGNLKPCASCTGGKVEQKNIPKLSEGRPLKAGESRIYLAIARVKRRDGESLVRKPNWKIMVEEGTKITFSTFFEKKSAWLSQLVSSLRDGDKTA